MGGMYVILKTFGVYSTLGFVILRQGVTGTVIGEGATGGGGTGRGYGES